VRRTLTVAAIAAGLLASASPQALAAGKNGTTLAAYKTLDICVRSDGDWQYSGKFAIWNSGAILTQGIAAEDCIQKKVEGSQFEDVDTLCTTDFDPPLAEVDPGTSEGTAVTYDYEIVGQALPGVDIRNSLYLSILNHSGSVGTPKGPNPKATWTGGEPPPCAEEPPAQCVYTQGYWDNKPNVVWPSPYDRNALFYELINQPDPDTWQEVMSAPNGSAPAYYQLAHQYIAALLNVASGAISPDGVEGPAVTIALADAWFGSHVPADCTKGCGEQKDWAAVLTSFNEGKYPNGPLHCGDE
jgi:hypothetical protein